MEPASQECPQTILSPMQGEKEVPQGIQSNRHSGPIFSCSQDLPRCCYTGSLHSVGLYSMPGSDLFPILHCRDSSVWPIHTVCFSKTLSSNIREWASFLGVKEGSLVQAHTQQRSPASLRMCNMTATSKLA